MKSTSSETSNEPWRVSIASILVLTMLVAILITLRRIGLSLGTIAGDGTVQFLPTMNLLIGMVAMLVTSLLGMAWATLAALPTRARYSIR